jgi:hypothetical protein
MSRLGLTQEETALLRRYAYGNETKMNRFTFYAAMIGPWVAFGMFGLVGRDASALTFGFVGLVFYTAWRTVGEFRYLAIFRSMASKVLAFDDASAVSPGAQGARVEKSR